MAASSSDCVKKTSALRRSPREKAAQTFLDLLSLDQMRTDTPDFDLT